MTNRTLSLTLAAGLVAGIALALTFATTKTATIHARSLHTYHAARDKIELGKASELTAAELWEINDRAPGHLLVPGFPWDNPRMTLWQTRADLYGNPKDPHP